MPPTDTSLMDYVVTYGGPSIFMTAVFVLVLPLVYFKFARPRYRRWPPRLAALLVVWCLAFAVAYGDVFLIARDAKRLCETEAGLKIYRTVEAEGFAGDSSIDTWSALGFSYVEDIGLNKKKYRYEMLGGQPTAVSVVEFKSEFEYFEKKMNLRRGIEKIEKSVRSVRAGEVTAELISFRAHPAWLDRVFLDLLGASIASPICDEKLLVPYEKRTFSVSDFIGRAIRPIVRAR
mgnify:CR=1 FL=1